MIVFFQAVYSFLSFFRQVACFFTPSVFLSTSSFVDGLPALPPNTNIGLNLFLFRDLSLFVASRQIDVPEMMDIERYASYTADTENSISKHK